MGMSTPEGGGRNRRRRSMSEINVTPLVDVMLVLLIIFMVATPMMQQGIEVALPETKSSGVSVKEDPFVLVIQKNKKITAGKSPIAIDELKSKISAIFETRSDKAIYIQADRQVDYGTVAEVMAEVRSAGITNIGLITLPKIQ